jgi:hypothetical protein
MVAEEDEYNIEGINAQHRHHLPQDEAAQQQLLQQQQQEQEQFARYLHSGYPNFSDDMRYDEMVTWWQSINDHYLGKANERELKLLRLPPYQRTVEDCINSSNSNFGGCSNNSQVGGTPWDATEKQYWEELQLTAQDDVWLTTTENAILPFQAKNNLCVLFSYHNANLLAVYHFNDSVPLPLALAEGEGEGVAAAAAAAAGDA